MKLHRTLPSLALALIASLSALSSAWAAPVELGRESFEAVPGIGYTTSVAEFDVGTPVSDFFGALINNGTLTVGGTISGGDGARFFAAEDLDTPPAALSPTQFLTTNAFSIAGKINTSVKILLAAPGTAPSGTVQNGGHQNHYDHDVTVANADFVRVEASVDGGPFNRLIQFSPHTATLNQPLSLDADGDYLGGGATTLNDTFQEFDLPITTGNSVQVRVVMHTNATNEYILVDNIRIFGEASATAVPALAGVSGTPLAYTEGDAATVLAGAITVSDTDSANLTSASVAIVANLASSEDVLSATPSGAILAGDISYTAGTGTLTITRNATLADYQAVLRTVKYQNTNVANPSTANRQIRFSVNDGANNSNQPVREVAITDVVPTQSIPFTDSFETDGRGTRYALDGRFTIVSPAGTFDRAATTGFTNGDGSNGIIGEDTQLDNALNTKAVRYVFNSAGLINLKVNVRLGAAGAVFDENDRITIEASVNGGAYTEVADFRSASISILNTALALDTNGDNLGDSTALSTALQDFEFNLPTASSTLGLRILMNSNSLGEKMALDRVVVTGDLPAPEIAVTETGVGNIPDNTGTFSFGTTTVGTPVTKTFTVTNSGTATLNLAALSFPSGFTSSSFVSSTVAASGGTTTFQVTMSAAAAATPSGTLSITNNDGDENPYNFAISGTVTAPAGIAQMGSSASQYSTSSTMSYTVNAGTDRLLVVALGDPNTFTNPTAVTYNGTPMLQANVANDGAFSNDAIWYLKLDTGGAITGNIVATFAAGGNGTSQRFIGASAYSGVDQTTPVDINGPKLTGSHTGTNLGSSLNVTSQTGDVVFDLFDAYYTPSQSSITTGASQTRINDAGGAITPTGGFGHYVTSTEAGAPTVTMSWTSNAEAVLHLTMNINAAAGGAPTAPEIAVSETVAGNIADGGGPISFGTTTVGTPVTKTFTVTNTGSAPLTLSGLLAPSGFAVSQDFASTTVAAGGGTTTFQIQMHAVSAGPQSGSVTFTSNDADEGSYNFTVSGTVNAPVSPDYTVTTASGTLTITDSAGNGDTLSLSAPSAGNILFTATGRTFSLNGAAATTNNSGTISLASITSIVVNAAGGSDTVTVNGFTALRSLTINGGTGDDTVNFGGNVTFAAGANLDVDLQNDDPAPGVDSVIILANADVETSGSGSITVKASRSISIGAGGGLTTADGDLILEANQQTVPTAGTFFGVEVLGTVSSIGLGNVAISGRGGNAGNPNDGVELIDPAAVILSNSGDLTLTGVAGVGASSEGVGLDAGTVTTFSGNLSLIGDTVFIGGSATVTATGLNVAVKPLTPGRPITVGTVVAGSLTIFNGLNRITCDTVNLGDSASGAITVNQVISPANYRTLAFGKGTTFTATGGFTATVPSATTYERMTVAGGVTITAGATFAAASSGGYVWNGTDSFTFLDNDLSDAITGTFTGPTLANFLGSALTAAQSYTGGSGNDFVIVPPAEIAVAYDGNNVADGSASVATLNGTDFGNVPVQGVTVDHVFTITNTGGTALTLGSVTAGGDFTVTQPTSPVAANGGTTTFTVSFNPSATGTRTATISFTNSDTSESPFDFAVSGIGSGPRTFDLAGNAVSNTPFESGETYIYSAVVGPPPPAPVVSVGGQDVVTGGNAPDGTGADSGLDFDMLTRGGFIAENGHLAFPGELTGPGVDGTNFKGFWKHNGTLLSRLARTGDNAPETGATAAKFSDLPLIPGINDAGQVTLLAALAANPGSTPPTTIDNDTGLWSELGGTGFQILMREGDDIPAQVPPLPAGTKLGAFGFGCFATADTGAGTAQAAFTAKFKGGSTDSALLRANILNDTVTAVDVVARENDAAPGIAGQTFAVLNSTYTSAVRMDAQGNIVFGAVLKPINKTSIWYQPVAGGDPAAAVVGGNAAPGTTGATFAAVDVPVMGDSGTFAFRGVLNRDGDNTANDKNDGIWLSVAGATSTNILRRGDSNTNRPGLFTGAILTANPNIKAGNIWSGWLTNSNHGAWLGWVDLAGNGISGYPADTFGIYTDLSGTMNLLISSGDPAPGIAGATLFFVDHPVVSGTAPTEHLAFIATVTGGGSTAANNKGIWRSLNGAAPTLVLRTGDAMTVTPGGAKTIEQIDLPGSGDASHTWETPVMDANGRLLVFVTFTDGTTTQIIVP